MKREFDTFLAQNKVYEKYYKLLKEELDSEEFHRVTPPDDWIWNAFTFAGADSDIWFDLATKWETIANG